MRITAARCQTIDTPAAIRLHTSYGAPETTREHVLVELETDDGLLGRGEASPLPYFTGETAGSICLHLRQQLLPGLIGCSPWDLPAIHAGMRHRLSHNSSARAAVDMALYDLLAQSAGQPLYRFLGWDGAATLPRTYALGIGGPEEDARAAREWVARGYRTLKLKIGAGLAADVERVTAVREAVGGGVNLRVDANGGYRLAEARAVLKALEPLDLELAEQPLDAADLDGWRQLRRAVNMPLMADESLHSPVDALTLARERLVDFFVIKLVKAGGIWYALQIAAIAQAAGIECIVSTPFDTAIGAAAAAHLAFAIGSRHHSHDLPPLAQESVRMAGRLHPIEAVGIGVTELPDREASWELEAP